MRGQLQTPAALLLWKCPCRFVPEGSPESLSIGGWEELCRREIFLFSTAYCDL